MLFILKVVSECWHLVVSLGTTGPREQENPMGQSYI